MASFSSDSIGYHETNDKEVTVKLPDLFHSFLKDPPVLNPHYEEIGKESEKWLSRFCSLAPAMQKKIKKCDFSYFVAIAAPYAPATKFRIMCDWGNWVFPFDDMFDDGNLRNEPEKSKHIMASFLQPFNGDQPRDDERMRIVEAHDDLAKRMFFACLPGVKRRYIHTMQLYVLGVLAHVCDHGAIENTSFEKMMELRRDSIGAAPLYHLIEYAHDLEIPDEVFEYPVIEELGNLGADIVFITNDIVSYRKEETEGIPDNIVATCRLDGMSAQQAFDTVGTLLEEQFKRWDIAEASVPIWGEPVNSHVKKYIDGIKAVVRANLYWSFRTDRYMGQDPEEVRRTGLITVLEHPPYLNKKT
ncbi:uncharacterized protein TRUGW13939_00878 [Talaromyces rugulosus]|uniref:Terpene synthase n=1 Tax=Talaromyces rugulosus TaxID=121627 RepID=A0A7H8QIL3_TALRU|nr:uncharacterized protein TRUGW13939_00878 [Talaromyces rugulosus]QKX53798.1 hypothetical protein TRUGW13939_00878 [Talaromyces rugulosus]